MSERLRQQLAFLLEADKLKRVDRRTPLADASRLENSAEHSWHLILAAMVLREHAVEPFDVLRTIEMAAVHDLVEIDAGDTFAYDPAAKATQHARELVAAERVFGMLPPDQHARLYALWEEFEACETPEARYANALDRLQPLLQNAHSQGGSWRGRALGRTDILERMAPVRTALPDLWETVVKVVDAFTAAGVLRDEPVH